MNSVKRLNRSGHPTSVGVDCKIAYFFLWSRSGPVSGQTTVLKQECKWRVRLGRNALVGLACNQDSSSKMLLYIEGLQE